MISSVICVTIRQQFLTACQPKKLIIMRLLSLITKHQTVCSSFINRESFMYFHFILHYLFKVIDESRSS